MTGRSPLAVARVHPHSRPPGSERSPVSNEPYDPVRRSPKRPGASARWRGGGKTGHNRRLCRRLPVTPSEVTLASRHTAGRDRLRHPGRLLPLRPRHRVRAQALHEDERGLLPLRALDPGLDRRPRLPLREPRRAGDDRHGRLRRQVRHRHRPLLLGGRHPGHGVRGHLHDALLLRLEGALGARVPEAALRREDPRPSTRSPSPR